MNHYKSLIIKTPEGIAFPLRIASPVTRFLALIIDLACISLGTSVATTLTILLSPISADIAAATGMILGFMLSIGYPIVMEWYMRGQTFGKRIMKMRVLDAQGLKLHPSQIVIRNLLRPIDMMPLFYLTGGISCFINQRGQRIGDLAANTIVIQESILRKPDLDTFFAGKYNSFLEYPHINARLRQNVTIKEFGIVIQALMRRDLLEDEARTQLFHNLKDHLLQKATYPTQIIEAISDEQYVRNAAEILYK